MFGKKKEVKKIEGQLWGYMIGTHKVSVDVLQNLRRVERSGEGKIVMIRIFDPSTASEKGETINDYDSLDSHPELILYEGHYEETRGEAMNIYIAEK
ncbi:MAG TPA: hypothetical protein G4O06_00430 [Dehalococcoidia bacterium]|nr:hypothetical protein [Dehalococcoidia bacterium]